MLNSEILVSKVDDYQNVVQERNANLENISKIINRLKNKASFEASTQTDDLLFGSDRDNKFRNNTIQEQQELLSDEAEEAVSVEIKPYNNPSLVIDSQFSEL